MAVVQQTGIRVSINKQSRDNIRTVAMPPSTTSQQLRGLTDVDATTLIDNEAVIYDAGTNKFVVKIIPVIDGGTF
jgi:hypothetical protein